MKRKEHFAKKTAVCEILVDILEWSMLINVSLSEIYYIIKWIGDLDMGKKIVRYHLNSCGWLKLTTCSYTSREQILYTK